MSSRDHRREPEPDPEVSFEGVVDLGSIPPPASGHVDVHRAPTAVATMTDELMDEIARARMEAKQREGDKTRVLPKFQMPNDAIPGFTDETPTRPGKEKDTERSPEKSGAVRRPEAPELLAAESKAGSGSGMTVAVTGAPERVSSVGRRAESAADRTEALAAPPVQASLPPLPSVAFADTIPAAAPVSKPQRSRRAAWPRILFLLVTLAALVVSALALRRYRASRLRR